MELQSVDNHSQHTLFFTAIFLISLGLFAHLTTFTINGQELENTTKKPDIVKSEKDKVPTPTIQKVAPSIDDTSLVEEDSITDEDSQVVEKTINESPHVQFHLTSKDSELAVTQITYSEPIQQPTLEETGVNAPQQPITDQIIESVVELDDATVDAVVKSWEDRYKVEIIPIINSQLIIEREGIRAVTTLPVDANTTGRNISVFVGQIKKSVIFYPDTIIDHLDNIHLIDSVDYSSSVPVVLTAQN